MPGLDLRVRSAQWWEEKGPARCKSGPENQGSPHLTGKGLHGSVAPASRTAEKIVAGCVKIGELANRGCPYLLLIVHKWFGMGCVAVA